MLKNMVLKLEGTNDFFTREAYNTLRTNIQFCGQDVRVIAITSCYENEGKTVITLNLGRSLAELGKKVLVIDGDMRKSVIAGRHTNVKTPVGLSEVLTGMNSVGECIYETQLPNLHVMFSGKYPPNPVELLNGKYFAEFLQAAREQYDYVLIDTPPLGRVIDAAVVTPLCDGAVLVMADRAIRYHVAKEVVEQIKKSGCRILGVVCNNVNGKKNRYGRGDGYYGKYYGRYGGYRQYGKYYGAAATEEKTEK